MSNKKLTLTIVIPAYNEQDYIRNCLDSIAGQTVMPNQVILVDNNSSDKTVEIAKDYSFVEVIKEPKQGVFFASSKGFDRSVSDLIGRIDADTILREDWVENVLQEISYGHIAAVTGPVYYYDMPFPRSNYWFDHLMRLMTYKWAPKSPFLYGSNLAIRKSVWDEVKTELCTEQDIHEDIDLAIHVSKKNKKILYSKKILSGASGRRYNDGLLAFWDYMSMYYRTYLSHRLYSSAFLAATIMWLLGYLIFHPIRNVWYFLYSQLNSFYPLRGEVRKNPMSG